MTNLVPQSIEEWMRTMERKYRDLATRRTTVSMTNVSTPRWHSRLAADTGVANSTVANLGYATVSAAPQHDVGDPAFVSYVTPGGEPRYLFDTAGLYLVRASLQWNGNGTGTRKMHMFLNAGTTPLYSVEVANAGAGAGVHCEVMGVWPFAAGDYLRVAAWQNSGVSLTVFAAGSAGNYAPSTLSITPLGAYGL